MSEMSLRFKLVCTAVVTFMAVAWGVAATAPPAARVSPAGTTILGQSRRAGGTGVRSWIRLDDHSKPDAVGVTFGEGVLGVLGDGEIAVEFPRGVVPLPFDHVAL